MRQHWKWTRSAAIVSLAVAVGLVGCDDGGGSSSGADASSSEGGTDEGGAGDGSSAADGSGEGGSGGDGSGEGGSEDGAEGGDGSGEDGSESDGSEGEEGPGEDGSGEGGEPIVDLLVDTNRNGAIDDADPTEEDGEDSWSESRGAIFLANLDDDASSCSKFAGTDYELAACFDGADEVVNGETDLLDMAPLRIAAWPGAPATARGKLFWSPNKAAKVRVFKKAGSDYIPWVPASDELSAEELRMGVDFFLEGTGIVTNKAEWDGFVTVTLRTYDGEESVGEDKVMLRVAPLLLFHHLLEGERIYVTKITANWGAQPSTWFRDDIRDGLELASFDTENEYWEFLQSDQWAQDYFEPGVMTMPGPGGTQHAIRVHLRSANVYNPNSQNPLRPAGRVVFEWRGPDTAAMQLFDLTHPGQMDSLDSFGNTETIPPYSHNGQEYPLGRIYRGNVPNFYPDPKQVKMMEDQLMQPPVYTDTSWLLVGHVDETITFLKYPNDRGWVILSNDAAMAKQMLEDQVAAGNGAVTMFKGKKWYTGSGEPSAEISIEDVLDNTNVMNESLKAVAEMLEQEEVLKEAVGLTDEDIFHIPYLHENASGYSLAYQVGTINGLVLDGTHYFAPATHGPEIDGKDIMAEQFLQVVEGQLGLTVHWVENWDLYHALSGEVHCGTNTMRKIPDVKWWETGR